MRGRVNEFGQSVEQSLKAAIILINVVNELLIAVMDLTLQ